MNKYCFALFLIVMACISNASTQTGYISTILVRDDGLHWIYVTGERTEKPQCSVNHSYWMIKDEASNYGQSQFALLISAMMANKKVKITGDGSCTRWGDGEDIRTVQVIN